jgi:predicted GIY-YIG superfamily endonuclease
MDQCVPLKEFRGTMGDSSLPHASTRAPLRMTDCEREDYICNLDLKMASAWIYILTNKHHTTLYVGVTNDLPTRLWEHRTKRAPSSFSARYNLNELVYYEPFDSIVEAIKREKYIRKKPGNGRKT